MSDETNLSYQTKFKILATSQEKMPMDLKEIDIKAEENKAFLQHNSIEETKKEVAFIDKLLSEEYKNEEETSNIPEKLKLHLTEEDRMLLTNHKTMGLANLLLNNHTKEDSKEMTDVKIDILNFSKVMEECRSLPPTEENLDKVDIAIKVAVNSCAYYCNHKNPHFSTGKKRKRMVYDVMMNLMTESERFVLVRRNLKRGDDEQKIPATIGEIFGMTEEGLKRPKTKKEAAAANQPAQENVQEQPVQAGPIEYPQSIQKVRDIFSSNYNFAEKIKAQYKGKKDRAAQANKVSRLLDQLRLFTPGSPALCNVDVMGQKVTLLQKSNGAMFVLIDHKEYPLERSASTICMEIENEIFAQTDVYGEAELRSLLELYGSEEYKSHMTSGENNRIRSMLAKYLHNKTGLVENEFNNTFRDKMVDYACRLLDGRITPEEVAAEVTEHSKSGVFINGVALSEMVELNKNRNDDEVAAMVDMNAQPKVELIPPGWSKGEQQVKNMISEMIFSADTEQMEKGLSMPGKFLKDIIKNHKEAMDALVAAKGKEEDMITGILNKMSIGSLDGEINGTRVRLSAVMAECINAVRDLYENANGGEIAEDALAEIMHRLDAVVEQSCVIMQKNADVMTETIFPEVVAEGNQRKSLRQQVKESLQSDKGQGKFMRKVMNTYFANVSTIDKRAMLAAVFRTAKTVTEDHSSDDALIEEIKKTGLPRFRRVFADKTRQKNEEGNMVYVLTDEERQSLTEYREYKHTLAMQSNFMAGMIRGAGPLMHKMLQGLPVSSLPEELKEALSDVKSNLPSIPDNLVQNEFLSLVESSNGRITRIEKIKSVGAASVGETFLCKVYGPAEELKNGKEVVIKILRPDAKNRMQREESVMLQAARDTDEAMYLTYKGQLNNYKKELDLTIEGENCKAGYKNYTGKYDDVETMKVLDGVPATSTSLIVEKAEGENLDKYIKSLQKFSDDTMGDLYQKNVLNDGTVEVITDLMYNPLFTPEENMAFTNTLAEKKDALLAKMDEAIRRRDHLVNLCALWIDEATMKENSKGGGFYHGDLHAGNMMIDDEKITFIDYGNTVQLNSVQQLAIGRMTIAAGSSIVQKASESAIDLFYNSFNDLISENNDPEFKAIYTEQKKRELKQAFSEILKMGNEFETSFRISLCLSKAQELGIKIPPAIQNYAQGQVRLQNSIDEMNKAIHSMKVGINAIETATSSSSFSFDPAMAFQYKFMEKEEGVSNKDFYKRQIMNMVPLNEEEFKQEILDETYIEGDEAKGQREVDKREEYKEKYLSRFGELFDEWTTQELYNVGFTREELESYGTPEEELDALEEQPKLRDLFEEFARTYWVENPPDGYEDAKRNITRKLSPPLSTSDLFGGSVMYGQLLYEGLENKDRTKIEKIFELYETNLRKVYELRAKHETLWKNQKKLKDSEKTEKVNEIYQAYSALHEKMAASDAFFAKISLHVDQYHSETEMDKGLVPLFMIEKDGIGELLRQRYNAFRELHSKYLVKDEKTKKETWIGTEEQKQQMAERKAAFMETYVVATRVRLMDIYERLYAKEFSVKYKDYDTVMEQVVRKNFRLNNIFFAAADITSKLGKDALAVLFKAYT